MKYSLSFERVTHNISRRFKWVTLLSFVLMAPACSSESVSSADPSLCGNGVLDEDEICDDKLLSDEASCPEGTSLPSNAALSCNTDCSLNTDACVPNESKKLCGNGKVEKGEVCDGEVMSNKAVCPEGMHLPADASLSCNADCTVNTDACVPDASADLCGNGKLDDGEVCDGGSVSDKASCPEGMYLPSDADFSCNSDCTLNTDACVPDESSGPCGNGKLDEEEICDGGSMSGNASCPQGMHLPEGKALACNEDCSLDTSACVADASATIPQGRVKPDEANPNAEEIQLHRTPQHNFPNEDLYADRPNEPSQIVAKIPKGEVVDIVGAVGDILLVQYHEFKGYLRSANIERINDLEVPSLKNISVPSNNYYQMDTRWKDARISDYTIEKMGGIPVSVADAISTIKKDDSITPDKVADKMSPTFGKSSDHVRKFIEKEYRLTTEHVDNTNGMNCVKSKKNDASVRDKSKQKLLEAFKNGWYIIADEGEDGSDYWEADRNVMVYGYDSENDRIYFDDPRNRHYMDDSGLDAFLNCNHSLTIITDKCIPYACSELMECGEVSDGCGGTMNCPCKPMGTAKNKMQYRRSPQNKFPAPNYTNALLNETHTSGITAPNTSEVAQIAGTMEKGETFEIIGKVKKSFWTPEWYQISYKDNKYFVLASDVQTNGAKVDNLTYFVGATNNYAQGDGQWGGTQYSCSGCSIGSDGCGPTSMANALSALAETKAITPKTIADEFKKTGSENRDIRGTYSDNRMCTIQTVSKYNIDCNYVAGKDKNKIIDTLKAGGYVVVYHGKAGYWTNAGHYITVYGYDGTNFYADDPMGRKYHQKADDFMKTVSGAAYIKKKK